MSQIFIHEVSPAGNTNGLNRFDLSSLKNQRLISMRYPFIDYPLTQLPLAQRQPGRRERLTVLFLGEDISLKRYVHQPSSWIHKVGFKAISLLMVGIQLHLNSKFYNCQIRMCPNLQWLKTGNYNQPSPMDREQRI